MCPKQRRCQSPSVDCSYHVLGPLIGLSLLHRLGTLSMPAPNLGLASEQDEGVALVHGTLGEWDLRERHVLLGALDTEENWMLWIWFDMVEAGLNASVQILNSLKVRMEFGVFMTLNLTVLNWNSAEVVIRLDHLVGCCRTRDW